MLNSELVIGLDVGTTNIKCLVLDAVGTIVAQASEITPHSHPRVGWTNFEPAALWEAVCRTIRAVIVQVPHREAIKGISAASLAESLVPVDTRGQPLGPAIAWFDPRTASQERWIVEKFGHKTLFEITGANSDPVFGLCKVLWAKKHQPTVFREARYWLHLADYVAFRLCGVPATDPSLASRTLAYDLRRAKWSEELLEGAGVPLGTFPPICQSGSPLGTLTPVAAAETNLPPGTVVSVGIHDHLGGAFAVGGIHSDVLFDSIGTSESLNRLIPAPIMDARIPERGLTQGAVWIKPQPDCFVAGGLQTAGAAVEWFRREAGGQVSLDVLGHEAAEVTGLVPVFLPHLTRSVAPHPDTEAAAAFVGIKSSTTRGGMYRAVLEGLAFEARAIADAMEADAGLQRCRHVLTIGGALQNPLLAQIKADVYNVPVKVSPVREATSLGAALLAGMGSGVFADAAAAVDAVYREGICYEPNPATSENLQARYQEIYRSLYRHLQETHHRMHLHAESADQAKAEPRRDQHAHNHCH